jgi:hypothetical protein
VRRRWRVVADCKSVVQKTEMVRIHSLTPGLDSECNEARHSERSKAASLRAKRSTSLRETKQERVRLAEGAVLKTVDFNRFGGSIPSLSAGRFIKES